MLQLETHAGTGVDLVLLPGWGSDATIFSTLVSRLTPYFNLHLGSWTEPQCIADTAVALREQLLETLLTHTPEKAIWVGWSLGGQLALEVAGRYPERVERVMTLACNPCFVQKDDWRSAMPVLEFNQFCQAFKDSPSTALKRFQTLQTLGSPDRRSLVNVLASSKTSLSTDALYLLLNLLAEDLRERVQQLNVPQMHCYGALDALVPSTELILAMKELNPQIQTCCYAKASHLPFLSASDEWVNDLRQWSDE